MKKKFSILLLLVLLLQLLTQASFATEKINISQLREQIPARWVQEYHAHGRTISVDVSPIAPEVKSVPILKVIQNVDMPDISNLSGDWTSDVSNIGIFHINIGDPYAEDDKIKNLKPAHFYPPFDFEKSYAENNPLTLGEVIEYLETTINEINHGQWCFKRPYYVSTDVMMENKNKNDEFQSSYVLFFKQELDNIPILNHAEFSVDEPKGEPPSITPKLISVFRTLNDFNLFGDMVEIDEVLVDDVPLCNFSEVQKSIEKEILAGHIRHIFDIELGYVLYNQPNATWPAKREFKLDYYAVPMWVVNCYYVPSPRTELRDYTGLDVPERGIIEYKQLFFNAQTGEIIDRKNNRKGIEVYTGFLSWEDVGGKP